MVIFVLSKRARVSRRSWVSSYSLGVHVPAGPGCRGVAHRATQRMDGDPPVLVAKTGSRLKHLCQSSFLVASSQNFWSGGNTTGATS